MMFDELHVHVYRDGNLVKTFNKNAVDSDTDPQDYSQISRDAAQYIVTIRDRVEVSVYGRRYRTDSFDTIEFLSKTLDIPRPWTTDHVSKTIFSMIQQISFRVPRSVS